MEITIHEFDEGNRFFKEKGAKFFPQLRNRTLNKTELKLIDLSTWGIVPRAIRYKSILNYDAVIYVGKTYVGDDVGDIYPKTFKANYELKWSEEIFPTNFNADIYNAICHCMGIPFIFISPDNQISAEVAESYSGDSYYILTSPYELQHTLRKLNISSKSKVLLLQLDNDFDDDDEDTLSDVLDAISVVENTLSNWK